MDTERRWLRLKTDLVPGAEELRDFREELETVLSLLDTLVDVADQAEILVLLATDPISAVLAAGITLLERSLAQVSRLGASCIVIPAMTSSTTRPDYDNLGPDNFLLGSSLADVTRTSLSEENRVDSPIKSFFEVFAASLEDQGDVSRPQYPDDHYVAGIALLVGAPNAIELLRKIAKLQTLWRKLITLPMDFAELPRPKNLTALSYLPTMGPISGIEWTVQEFLNGRSADIENGAFFQEGGHPSVGDSNLAVVLRWDAPILGLQQVFSSLRFEVNEIRLYLKPDEDFDDGDRGENLENFQIKRLSYLSTHTTIIGLDPDRTYYAAVGYKLTVREYDRDLELIGQDTLEHYDISNSVRISVSEDHSAVPQGELPDWVGINSPYDLAPPVRRIMERAKELLEELKNNIVGSKVDEYREFIAMIRKRIASIRATYSEFLELYDDLVEFLELLSLDLFLYAFFGRGGTRLLTSEMWSALLDPRTEGRPTFDTQSAAVTGLVMVAGAPSLAGLDPFMDLLGLLVGDTGVRRTLGADVRTRTSEPAATTTGTQLRELETLVVALESRRDQVLAAAVAELQMEDSARPRETPGDDC